MSAALYRDAISWFEAEAEIAEWDHARSMFWASTGPARVYWRGVWRHLIQRERERLYAGRASLHAAYLRRVP